MKSLISWAVIPEGLHMFMRHQRVRGKYFKRYSGNAKKISMSILSDLWNGSFMKTSTGHYPVFFSRDFSMMMPSLLALGMKKQIRSSLAYALYHYHRKGAITTFITRKNIPTNFPNVYSPDSVAYMFYSLRLLGDKKLVDKYRVFLQQEVHKFFSIVVDKKTHLVKRKKHFGGMRDHAKRDASCYDMTMLALLVREAKTLGFIVPYKKDPLKLLVKNYWNGSYFRDDLSSLQLTADANIYPFWLGLLKDKKLLRTMLSSLHKECLDSPFPVRYVKDEREKGDMIFLEKLFVPNWEGDGIWPMSALPYIQTLAMVNKAQAKKHLAQYTSLIEKYATFIEVYTIKGTPYKSFFYSADEGMIWCALYLHLANTL